MEKRNITIQEAKKVWAEISKNEFTLIYYQTFEDYWKECERINNLPEEEWQKLIDENQEKINKIIKLTKR